LFSKHSLVIVLKILLAQLVQKAKLDPKVLRVHPGKKVWMVSVDLMEFLAKMEKLGHKAIPGMMASQENLGRKALLEKTGSLVFKAPPDVWGCKVLEVRLVNLETKDLRVLQDQKEHQALMEKKGLKVHRDLWVHAVKRERLDLKAKKVCKDLKAHMDRQGQLEKKVRRENLVMSACQDNQDPLDHLEQMVPRVQEVRLECVDHLVPQVALVQMAQKVPKVVMVHQGSLGRMVHMVKKECQVLMVKQAQRGSQDPQALALQDLQGLLGRKGLKDLMMELMS
jgi:hypothetical protein